MADPQGAHRWDSIESIPVLQAPDSKKLECAPILETVTEGEVQRLEGLVESGWIGDLVRLKFDLKDAKIYSIRLTDE